MKTKREKWENKEIGKEEEWRKMKEIRRGNG